MSSDLLVFYYVWTEIGGVNRDIVLPCASFIQFASTFHVKLRNFEHTLLN